MNESLWLDEATTALVSKMSVTDIFTKFLPNDFHPPFYYLIMKFWVLLFGNSEISLRMPSLIFAGLTVFVIYKLFGRISAILLATSSLFVYYAQEARMYSLVTFLVTLLVYFFLKKKWLWFSLVLVLTSLTNYTALLVIPVFWILDYKNWKRLLICHIPLFLFFLFWSPFFLQQMASGLSASSSSWGDLLGRASMKNMLLIPVKFMIGRVSFDNNYIYTSIVGSVSLLFGYLIYKAKSAQKIVWLWLLVPPFLAVLLSLRLSILTYFRLLFVLPALYVLISNGIHNTGRYKKLFFVLVLIVNLSCNLYYILTPSFHREDWRSAASSIGNEKIVFPVNSQKEALIYYDKEQNILDINNFEGKEDQVWLSRYVAEVFDPANSAVMKIESLGYNKSLEVSFNGVVFWKYVKQK